MSNWQVIIKPIKGSGQHMKQCQNICGHRFLCKPTHRWRHDAQYQVDKSIYYTAVLNTRFWLVNHGVLQSVISVLQTVAMGAAMMSDSGGPFLRQNIDFFSK